jgi:hypothetical protein
VTSPAAVRAQRATSPVIAIRGLIGHGLDKLVFGRPATIADMRRIGVSAVVIECAALYCYHRARIEFDALGLPTPLIA